MATHHPIRKSVPVEAPVIPDKLYFRIGDVAALCDVQPYVLRFWETEFPQLKPNKGGTGQRLYRKRDVETALRIKSLLYDQGYTIPGARQVFKSEAQPKSETQVRETPEFASESQTQAEPQPRPVSVVSAAVDGNTLIRDIGASIRQDAPYRDQLYSICAELRSIAEILRSKTTGGPAATAEPATPRLKLMRPRLMPDSKTESRPAPRLIDQGDLFPTE